MAAFPINLAHIQLFNEAVWNGSPSPWPTRASIAPNSVPLPLVDVEVGNVSVAFGGVGARLRSAAMNAESLVARSRLPVPVSETLLQES